MDQASYIHTYPHLHFLPLEQHWKAARHLLRVDGFRYSYDGVEGYCNKNRLQIMLSSLSVTNNEGTLTSWTVPLAYPRKSHGQHVHVIPHIFLNAMLAGGLGFSESAMTTLHPSWNSHEKLCHSDDKAYHPKRSIIFLDVFGTLFHVACVTFPIFLLTSNTPFRSWAQSKTILPSLLVPPSAKPLICSVYASVTNAKVWNGGRSCGHLINQYKSYTYIHLRTIYVYTAYNFTYACSLYL